MNELDFQKKLLIITDTLTSQKWLGIYALAEAFEKKKMKIDILLLNSKPQEYQKKLAIKADFLKSIPERQFILEFEAQEAQIETVKWNQTEQNLNIYINMQDGNFNPEKMNLKTVGTHYEQVIVLDIVSLNSIKQIQSKFINLAKTTKFVVIGKDLNLKDIQTEHHNPKQVNNLSEKIYKYFQKNSIKIPEKAANALLAGIFIATGNFTNESTVSETFLNSAQLLKKGADNKKAQQLKNAITKYK